MMQMTLDTGAVKEPEEEDVEESIPFSTRIFACVLIFGCWLFLTLSLYFLLEVLRTSNYTEDYAAFEQTYNSEGLEQAVRELGLQKLSVLKLRVLAFWADLQSRLDLD